MAKLGPITVDLVVGNVDVRCPVCEGRGVVPAGFYLPGYTPFSLQPEPCRRCAGLGTYQREGKHLTAEALDLADRMADAMLIGSGDEALRLQDEYIRLRYFMARNKEPDVVTHG